MMRHRPQEIFMKQPFEITSEGKVRIVGVFIRDNAHS